MLFSRARGLEAACAASLRHLDRSRASILASERGRRASAPRRTGFERAYIDVRATLATCTAGYKGISRMNQAGEMREQGVSIALKNQLAIRAFESAAESYLMSLGIRVRPYGAGPNPYAGSSRRN